MNPLAAVADLARAMVSSARPPRARAPSRRSPLQVHGGARNAGVGVQHLRHRGRAAPAPHALDEEEQRLGGFGVGRSGRGVAARSPMAGASSVAEAARARVEAKRLDGERKCVSPAERCQLRGDAAGTATRVASGRMVYRVSGTNSDGARGGSEARATRAHRRVSTSSRARARGTHRPSRHPWRSCNVRGVPTICSCAELDRWRYPETDLRNWWTCQIGDP